MVRKVLAARNSIIFDDSQNLISFCNELRTKEATIVLYEFRFFLASHTLPTLGGPSHSDISDVETVLEADSLLEETLQPLHDLLIPNQV
jgi:hypothetical protein